MGGLPVHVAKHSLPPVEVIEKLWALYVRAYRRVAQEAVSREMLFRQEFDSALSDPSNRLWVVWDGEAPVAMTLIATEAAATRYVSRAFFEHHYPDRMARGEIHYVMWAVVDPQYVARGAIVHLARGGLALEAEEGAFLVFDVPEVNQPSERGGASGLLIRLARHVGEATLVPLGVQRFYAVDFSRSRAASEGDDVPTDAEVRAYVPLARD